MAVPVVAAMALIRLGGAALARGGHHLALKQSARMLASTGRAVTPPTTEALKRSVGTLRGREKVLREQIAAAREAGRSTKGLEHRLQAAVTKRKGLESTLKANRLEESAAKGLVAAQRKLDAAAKLRQGAVGAGPSGTHAVAGGTWAERTRAMLDRGSDAMRTGWQHVRDMPKTPLLWGVGGATVGAGAAWALSGSGPSSHAAAAQTLPPALVPVVQQLQQSQAMAALAQLQALHFSAVDPRIAHAAALQGQLLLPPSPPVMNRLLGVGSY